MTVHESDADPQAVSRRLIQGLAKIAIASRGAAWQTGGAHGLTPTQIQLIGALDARAPQRLTELADALGVTLPTVGDAVNALVRKGLVTKAAARSDARARELRLTEAGQREARAMAGWQDFLIAAADGLTPAEQAVLLRGLLKMIRTLQVQGRIPIAQMCLGCQYFRPNAHPDQSAPHHCDFVDAPFGDAELRVDCPDFQHADPAHAAAIWTALTESAV